MIEPDMLERLKTGKGFIAALDQSGGSTPKALKGYGIEEGAWSNDEEMFDLIHQMRVRIITSPSFTGEKVLGAILFEKTMDGEAGGKPVPTALRDRGVVPIIKVDKGLEDEADGVVFRDQLDQAGGILRELGALDGFERRRRVAHAVRDGDADGLGAEIEPEQLARGGEGGEVQAKRSLTLRTKREFWIGRPTDSTRFLP